MVPRSRSLQRRGAPRRRPRRDSEVARSGEEPEDRTQRPTGARPRPARQASTMRRPVRRSLSFGRLLLGIAAALRGRPRRRAARARSGTSASTTSSTAMTSPHDQRHGEGSGLGCELHLHHPGGPGRDTQPCLQPSTTTGSQRDAPDARLPASVEALGHGQHGLRAGGTSTVRSVGRPRPDLGRLGRGRRRRGARSAQRQACHREAGGIGDADPLAADGQRNGLGRRTGPPSSSAPRPTSQRSLQACLDALGRPTPTVGPKPHSGPGRRAAVGRWT